MSGGTLHHDPGVSPHGGCSCDGCTGDASPRPEEFDPADTARRVAGAMTGMVWHTVARGDWTVTTAEPLRFEWPIRLRIHVTSVQWPTARTFEVDFDWGDTFPANGPDNNAQGLAGDGMILIEEYIETGPVGRLTEITNPP